MSILKEVFELIRKYLEKEIVFDELYHDFKRYDEIYLEETSYENIFIGSVLDYISGLIWELELEEERLKKFFTSLLIQKEPFFEFFYRNDPKIKIAKNEINQFLINEDIEEDEIYNVLSKYKHANKPFSSDILKRIEKFILIYTGYYDNEFSGLYKGRGINETEFDSLDFLIEKIENLIECFNGKRITYIRLSSIGFFTNKFNVEIF